jgi:hypothetical protein
MNGIESAKRKLARARQHLNALDTCAIRYMETVTNRVVDRIDGKQTIRFSKEPPIRLAILAGEIVYQLRSGLDHLAFELVRSNLSGTVLPKDWQRKCRFPLCLEVPTKGNPPRALPVPLSFNFFKDTLPGITPEAFAEIERLQPYNGGDGPTQLGWLEKLANIDKHRHLHVVIAQTYQTETMQSGTVGSQMINRLHDGAEIEPMLHGSGELENAAHVRRRILSPFVTFGEESLPTNLADVAVGEIFDICIAIVSRKVIPNFEALIMRNRKA